MASTYEGGGEYESPPHKMMYQWTVEIDRRPMQMAVHNGLAGLTRECENPAEAHIWETICELDRDVVAPKKAISMVSAAVPRPVMTFEERMHQTPLCIDRHD